MTLHLTLKKRWFEMILRGEKKEEYREIKPYWFMRLIYKPEKVMNYFGITEKPINQYCVDRIINHHAIMYGFNPIDTIVFKQGYSKNAPMVEVECRGIEVERTKSEWCDEGEVKVFVLKLGDILFFKNCNP